MILFRCPAVRLTVLYSLGIKEEQHNGSSPLLLVYYIIHKLQPKLEMPSHLLVMSVSCLGPMSLQSFLKGICSQKKNQEISPTKILFLVYSLCWVSLDTWRKQSQVTPIFKQNPFCSHWYSRGWKRRTRLDQKARRKKITSFTCTFSKPAAVNMLQECLHSWNSNTKRAQELSTLIPNRV